MSDSTPIPPVDAPLRILHVFRSPVGGLFRHVRDLAESQAAAGHLVGAICATDTSERIEQRLSDFESHLALGLRRMPILRGPNPGDLAGVGTLRAYQAETRAHIVHGHGAKGGVFARLGAGKARVVYTPHGGSLHYDSGTLAGFIYLGTERLLRSRTHAFAFESAFARDAFARKVGAPDAPAIVVHNGLRPEEFTPLGEDDIHYDVAFVGELRRLKGLDALFDALKLISKERPIRALITGDGPDAGYFKSRAGEIGLGGAVSFTGEMPALDAFARARMVVVPSICESLPYVVLEAVAAERPVVATTAGGIPEIFGVMAHRLVRPHDAIALAGRIREVLDNPAGARAEARAMTEDVANRFSLTRMVEGMNLAYRLALSTHAPAESASEPARTAASRS